MATDRTAGAKPSPAKSLDVPRRFTRASDLGEFMTRPSRAPVDVLARVDGAIIVLGVGGKMGPTLAGPAKRAAPRKRVIGVAVDVYHV